MGNLDFLGCCLCTIGVGDYFRRCLAAHFKIPPFFLQGGENHPPAGRVGDAQGEGNHITDGNSLAVCA